jgi:hypothetical protein
VTLRAENFLTNLVEFGNNSLIAVLCHFARLKLSSSWSA